MPFPPQKESPRRGRDEVAPGASPGKPDDWGEPATRAA